MNSDDDGEADDQEPAEEEPARSSKMTRSQLYQAYSGRGTLQLVEVVVYCGCVSRPYNLHNSLLLEGPVRMFCDLISDRRLQLEAICITEISKPLEKMYNADLKQQKKNQLQFAVRRCLAGNHWNP